MKGELTLKILELLEEAAVTTVDLVAAFLSSGYGASLNKINREFGRRHFHRSLIGGKKELAVKKKNFQNLLYKLKREGLIVDNADYFRLTRQGREKLSSLRSRLSKSLPDIANYRKEKDDKFKIVIFDVPEHQRRKRGWIRSVLTNLNFTMLQKSVWIGKNKIPEDLIEDLEKMELTPFVEILEISKTGTLKSVSGSRD